MNIPHLPPGKKKVFLNGVGLEAINLQIIEKTNILNRKNLNSDREKREMIILENLGCWYYCI